MKITTLEVAGFRPAMVAMRHPFESYAKSDSVWRTDEEGGFVIGPADRELSERLANAGTEHCKHLRLIDVWFDVEAPLYWHKEMDTYRAGVDKLSTSTMHTLTKKPLTVENFEFDANDAEASHAVNVLNLKIRNVQAETDPDKKKRKWRNLIQYLPEAFIQKRTVKASYAALRAIYHQREGHRLKEWQVFREWCETLPESWMITGKTAKTDEGENN